MKEFFIIMITVLIGIYLLLIPLCRFVDYKTITYYNSLSNSIKILRNNGNEIERAALANKIVRMNAIIDNAKFTNSILLLDYLTVDELTKLEYLK